MIDICGCFGRLRLTLSWWWPYFLLHLCGCFGAVAAFDGPIHCCVLGGVLRIFRGTLPRVNDRYYPTLLALFFVWSDAWIPYYLNIKALCCCKKWNGLDIGFCDYWVYGAIWKMFSYGYRPILRKWTFIVLNIPCLIITIRWTRYVLYCKSAHIGSCTLLAISDYCNGHEFWKMVCEAIFMWVSSHGCW